MARISEKMLYTVDADTARAKTELKNLDALFAKVGSGKGGGGMGAVFGGNIASQAVSALTGALLDGGKAVLDYSSRMEQTKIGFETLMGGAEAASKHLKELQDFAKSTPFEFEDLTTASRRLQNVGLEGSKIIPVMRDIGNAAAAAGASGTELNSITLAFSQIIAKGKLSAEEVNQLAERGIPVWRMLSKEMGKSKAEIIKMSEQGKISSEQFLSAFQKFSQANFGDAMERQSHTFAGAMSNIKDAVMITSSEMFKPLYEEISKFADTVAQSLTEQQSKAKGAGASFGFAVGEAVGAAYRRGIDSGGVLGLIDSLANLTAPFYANRLALGFAKGTNTPSMSIADLRKMDDAIGGIQLKTTKIKPLTFALDTEKAAKQAKTLSDTVDGLANRIAFFGDETEVAAIKQKLLNEGIFNFGSGLAKQAVYLAARIDKLTAAKKAQEDYNRGLVDASKEMQNLRATSDFNVKFPEATELDKFENWVHRQTSNFKELAGAIDITRRSLETDALLGAHGKAEKIRADALRAARQMTTDIRSPLGTVGETVEKSLSGITGVNASLYAKDIEEFVVEYDKLKRSLGDTAGANVGLAKISDDLKKFLDNIQIADGAGGFIRVFGEKAAADDFVKALLDLGDAVYDEKLVKGLPALDEMLTKLGLHLGNDDIGNLSKLDKELADPLVTAAISARAAALGMTADELKRLMKIAAGEEFPTTGPFYIDPKIFGDKDESTSFKDGFFGAIGLTKIDDEAKYIEGVYKRMGEMVGGTVEGMAEGVGSLVESWVLYGSAGPDAIRKMTASVLAGLAAEATVEMIMELARGFAALASGYNAWKAPLHFKSAALFGIVAAGAAISGRAIAGDSFRNGQTNSGSAGTHGSSSGSSSGNGTGNRSGEEQPFSRVSEGAFDSGNREMRRWVKMAENWGIQIPGRFGGSGQNRLAEAVEQLNSRLSSMRPGDVLVAGSRERRGFIGEQSVRDYRANAGTARQAASSMGIR